MYFLMLLSLFYFSPMPKVSFDFRQQHTLTLDNIYKHQNKNQMHFKIIPLHTG